MVNLTPGQKLALHQLNDISARSRGTLEIGDPFAPKEGDFVWVRVSLETRGYRNEGGLLLRDRERLYVRLFPDFPFKKPDIHFSHKRFIGKPHVQWGSYICLYQSEIEYDPSDGMFGFIERVRSWMSAAGGGQLDPEDAPLHPPIAYSSSPHKFVIRANTPSLEQAGTIWLGFADLTKVRTERFDVTGWKHISDWDETESVQQVAGVLLFDKPLAMEYPSNVDNLIKLVESAGLEFAQLYLLLRLLAILSPENESAFLILGAPMRRKAAGEPLRQHLTVWEIGAEPLNILRALIRSKGEDTASSRELARWMVEAEVRWCAVLEDRPEIVHRRDSKSVLSAFSGRRVLLLGCGALGSAVAESIVRAGAASLHLADIGSVKPGLLVRQRYTDADIGLPKAEALKNRLDGIGVSCQVTMEVCDLSAQALSRFQLEMFDLVIDATASTKVMHRLERELKETILGLPLISLTVSAAANHGSVTVRMPEYIGGPHCITRQSKLEVFARDPQHPLIKAFWPSQGDTRIFQPEPGCSEPTFVGSAADIDHHAAALLNLGVVRTQELKSNETSVDFITAPWIKRKPQEASQLSYVFEGYSPASEQRHGYVVLQSAIAARNMASEMRRIARVRSDKIETGGLIFGEIDDSHRYVWIDFVSGPPPDSIASAERFLCGVEGTRELANLRTKSSGGSSKFIGIWHTHPISRGQPSEEDLIAMVKLLHGQENPPRQVVMLIVGFAATVPALNYYLYRRDEFRLIPLDELPEGVNS